MADYIVVNKEQIVEENQNLTVSCGGRHIEGYLKCVLETGIIVKNINNDSEYIEYEDIEACNGIVGKNIVVGKMDE